VDNPKSTNSPNSNKAKYCGECGKKTHTFSRTKSGLQVCTDCHTRITNKQPKSSHSVTTTKPKLTGQSTEGHNTIGGSLLEGTYDEEANAAAFAEALAEWRNGESNHKVGGRTDGSVQSVTEHSTSCQTTTSTETNTTAHPPVINVTTSNSISYLERLMIRRNRYDHKFLRNTVTSKALNSTSSKPVSSSSMADEIQDNPAEPSPYNVFYEAPYQPKTTFQSSGEADYNCVDVTMTTNGTANYHKATDEPTVQLTAMQVAIKEAWISNETVGNLSHFFLTGVKGTTGSAVVSTLHNIEQKENTITKSTGMWQPELSTNNTIASQTDGHYASDSDDDAILNIDDCTSDDEEWELDDKMTLECLERELRASQLGWNTDQQKDQQIFNKCDNDFEDIETQKDEQ